MGATTEPVTARALARALQTTGLDTGTAYHMAVAYWRSCANATDDGDAAKLAGLAIAAIEDEHRHRGAATRPDGPCNSASYPHPDNPGQTHWHECWRERRHHNCTVAEIERLRSEINRLAEHGVISGGKAAEMQGLRVWQWRESLLHERGGRL